MGLCYSDLLPKSIARTLIRSEEPKKSNHNPVFVDGRNATQMNFRVAEYFLCAKCEHRLNQGGENWVLSNGYRHDGTFLLRDALRSTPTLENGQKTNVKDGLCATGVSLDKLIFFGASIFWKAAAREWTISRQRFRLSFGPYEEQLRLFLRGEGAFPRKAVLIIAVADNEQPFLGAEYPCDYGRAGAAAREFRFSMLGISFWLYQGEVTGYLRRLCAVRHGRILTALDLNAFHVATAEPIVAGSKPSKSLR